MGIRYFTFNDVLYLLDATKWTLLLSVIAFVGGGIVGALITLARISRIRALRWFAMSYVEVLQGTPLLMQLFLWFFLLTLFVPVKLPATLVAAMALTLNASSFVTEIWRGSIEAIPRTQWEAAASIGMSRFEQIKHIIAPQAVRIALAPTVGLLVIVIKGTSLTALIGFVELTRAGQLVSGVTFEPLRTFSFVAAIYLCLCWPLSAVSQRIERRLHAGRTPERGA
jgi:polar amino acid transport system permease protein